MQDYDVIKALQYFNSDDGPHISIAKLAIYCGINENTMRDYMKERYKPPEHVRRQIERGLSEMIKEMRREWPI